MVILKFICCMFIFFCGCGTGICIMCLVQINKPFEEKYNDIIREEYESFKYDCLNDEDNTHIPRID